MEAVLKTSRNQISKNIKRLASEGKENVLVYGCGRFTKEIKTKVDNLSTWQWFDPFVEGLDKIDKTQRFDNIILDNVLNVIKDDVDILTTLRDAFEMVEKGGLLHVNIYEGNKSGIGEFTDSKCQRNQSKFDYLWAFKGLNGLKWRINTNGGFTLEKGV